jgi:hypothetical protein
MSQVLIQRYFNDLDRIRSASGATRETVVREAFKDLLKQWGRQQDLVFIAEHEHMGPTKNRCYVDGALLHEIRVPFGYWEAKDTGDKLDEEIEKKKRKGYPQDNIIFEDSQQAVLIQDRQEVIRCEMSDAPHFEKLLSLFFRYERKEIAEFRKAVEQFKADLPSVLKALREKIEEAHAGNAAYKKTEAKFLEHAKETINPSLGSADVRGDEDDFPDTIKWSETLKRRKKAGQIEPFDSQRIRRTSYRPFSPVWLYASDLMIDRPGLAGRFFPPDAANTAICFSDVASRAAYCVMAVSGPADLHFGAAIDAYQQVARYSFVDGVRVDNITDWAFNRFRDHYEKGKGRVRRRLTKDDIFHYIYGVLHDPIYREKYGLNLKRELPRIPLYADFWQWASWGQDLMQLHLDYERADTFKLSRVDQPDEKARAAGVPCRPILRSSRESGTVTLDTETTLTGIPSAAWDYVLGNRSALDWVLDQHKEKAPKDKTIRAEFNAYRFADHKDEIIVLLKRVVTVSVKTLQIIEAMRDWPRDDAEAFISEIRPARGGPHVEDAW